MKRLLTALASLALVGTLFAGVPAKVAAVEVIQDRYFIVPALTANIDGDDDLYSSDDASDCDDAAVSRPDYEGYDTDVSNGYNNSGYFLNEIINTLVAGPVDDGDQIVLCEYGDGSAATYYLDETITIDGSMGSGDGWQDISIVGEGDVTISGYEREAITAYDFDGLGGGTDTWNSYDDFYDTQNWGCIAAEDTDLTLENITIEDCGDEGGESAVEVVNGSLHVEDVTFADNLADYGSAIHADSTTSTPIEVTLVDVNFDSNQADDAGGAIYLDDANLTATDSLFDGNAADSDSDEPGGAIASVTVNATMTEMTFVDTRFIENYADGKGGAIYAICADISISSDDEDDQADETVGVDAITADSYFDDNDAEDQGGAIFARKTAYSFGDPWGTNCSEESNPTLEIDGVEFMRNDSQYWHGGAIATYGYDVSVENSRFGLFDDEYRNYASEAGGAIYADGTTGYDTGDGWSDNAITPIEVAVSNSNFYQNYASSGSGGAIAVNCANLTVTGGWTPANYDQTIADWLYEAQVDYSSGTVFQWNESDEDDGGGAIATASRRCAAEVGTSIDGAEFYDNYSDDDDEGGGAIATNVDDLGWFANEFGYSGSSGDSDLTIASSVFAINATEDEDGGAIYFGDETSDLRVDNSVFHGNYADSDGGAIDTDSGDGSVTVTGSAFGGGYADDEGGAISSEKATTIRTSLFRYNEAEKGGAIDIEGGPSLTVSGSTFNENFAFCDGGGAIVVQEYVDDEFRLSVGSSTFTSNGAPDTGCGADHDGGAIMVENVDIDMNVNSSSFTDNFAAGDGGAISFWNDANLTVSSSTFTDNSSGWLAGDGGGAIRLDDGGSATITGSRFVGNTTTDNEDGGAIYSDNAYLTLSGSTFTGNNTKADPYLGDTAEDDGCGGAVYNSGDSYVLNSTFTGNIAGDECYGGAIDTSGDATIIGSTFKFNRAGSSGALDLDGVSLIKNSLFEGNVATVYDAGAVWAGGPDGVVAAITITGSTFIKNVAVTDGGAIAAYDSLMLQNNKFIGNSASFGGAVWAEGLTPGLAWFNGNLFDSNTATVGGGLAYEATSGNQKLVVNANRFTKNRATVGGGVYVVLTSTPAALPTAFTKNQFDGNIAGVGGGVAFGYNGAAYRTARAAQQAFDKAMKGNTFAATNRATGDKNTSKYGGILRTTVQGLFVK